MRLCRSILVAFLAFVVACCGRNPATPPSTATAPATLPGPRIVSTVPAATLNLVLLGAADRLVGVTKYDRLFLPPDKQNLPVVGDYLTLNYEQLVKLHPTVLIIQMAEARIEPKLRQAAAEQHFEILNLRFDHVADIWTSVRLLGNAAGREHSAEKAITRAQDELQNLEAKYHDRPHPKVAYLVDPENMILCGGNTFMDEMISGAGGANIGTKAGNGFLSTSREAMIKLAPEVLLIGAMDQMEAMPNDPRLRDWLDFPVPAAAAKRVYLITDGNSQMASIDIAKNVRALATLIHQGDPPPPAGPATTSAETRP
jgi:ABC-type Fe3+-hydroxamate transport system substrate-binding protein